MTGVFQAARSKTLSLRKLPRYYFPDCRLQFYCLLAMGLCFLAHQLGMRLFYPIMLLANPW